MFGTKFSASAMAAVRIAAAGAVGTAALAGAVLIVAPALPGHRVKPWFSTQPQNLASVTGNPRQSSGAGHRTARATARMG